MKNSLVVVLGASDKAERYSNMAVESLIECGYEVIPVNTAGKVIHGIQSVKSVCEIEESVDTLTMYVNPKISDQLSDKIIALGARRVIFNPGTENSDLMSELSSNGVEVIEACTLVMLRTNQF